MARIIDAFTQFFDDNGDPLVDGFLKFVESGTNNSDKDTFADINETIANANPVPLSGAGRCPNVFGSGSYNVISFTSEMVQIQQFDPVGGDAVTGDFPDWNSQTIYGEDDIVTGSDGLYYRSLSSGNQNQDPTTSAEQWEEVRFMGVYNLNITYDANDLVIDADGHIYRSLSGSNLNNTPDDNPDKWGDPTNIANLTTVTLTHDMASDADYALSTAENLNGRVIITDVTPNLTTARNIIVSIVKRTFIAQNDTLQTLTFKTSGGTGIPVLAGSSADLLCDGTNIIVPNNSVNDGTNEIPKTTVIAGSSKAWVNFNGVAGGTIRESFNVSSITDDGVGQYTVNLTDNMPSADYAVMSISGDRAGDGVEPVSVFVDGSTYAVGSFRLICVLPGSVTKIDIAVVHASILSN